MQNFLNVRKFISLLVWAKVMRLMKSTRHSMARAGMARAAYLWTSSSKKMVSTRSSKAPCLRLLRETVVCKRLFPSPYEAQSILERRKRKGLRAVSLPCVKITVIMKNFQVAGVRKFRKITLQGFSIPVIANHIANSWVKSKNVRCQQQ